MSKAGDPVGRERVSRQAISPMTVTPEAYQRITSRIFAAALDPRAWQGVLDEMSGLLDGAKLHLFGYDIERSTDLGVISVRHGREWIGLYQDYYVGLNPYPPLATKLTWAVPYDLSGLIPERELKRTEYFADFFHPQENLTGGAGIVIEATEKAAFVIGTMHPDRYRDRLDRDALEVLGTFGRNIGVAWEIGKKLGLAQLRAGRATGGQHLTGIVALLDQAGRAVFLSDDAEAALNMGTSIRSDLRGRLRLSDPTAQARLEGHLHALERKRRKAAESLVIRGETGSARLTLAPLDPDVLEAWPEAFLLGLRQPILMLVIDEMASNATARICNAGLTAAEREVAMLLGRELLPRQIARLRDVSLHTVRNQIRAACGKLGLSSAVQLGALAARADRGVH